MISVLCCGPCFDETAIAEDGSLYPFLDHLLEYKDAKVYQLAQETIVLLLEFNPDSSNILGKYIPIYQLFSYISYTYHFSHKILNTYVFF